MKVRLCVSYEMPVFQALNSWQGSPYLPGGGWVLWRGVDDRVPVRLGKDKSSLPERYEFGEELLVH